MNTAELELRCGFSVLHRGEPREIETIYCCDLLSLVMGRAPSGCAWVTVMGNVNAVAVATLADAACIIVAEDMPFDPQALEKAAHSGLTVYATALPIWEAAHRVFEAMQP